VNAIQHFKPNLLNSFEIFQLFTLISESFTVLFILYFPKKLFCELSDIREIVNITKKIIKSDPWKIYQD
jgi:hypothetical protein